MTNRVIAKTDIACEYLARGIELYLRGDSYASALHLAGAAEELLSVLVRAIPDAKGVAGKATLDQMKEFIVTLSQPSSPQEARDTEEWAHHRMTNPKNSVKHMHGLRDLGVRFDLREEAYDVIDRAISTYIQLEAKVRLPPITDISEFDARARTERKQ